MTTIAFRSPVAYPLHAEGWPRPAGSLDFRVTQEFDDIDHYWSTAHPELPPRHHRAVDIGQGRCGGAILAMAPGRATRLKDDATRLGAATDALGIRIDHGNGVTTAYWHLASWSVAGQTIVKAGQQIGVLGNTGLGAVCHCHIEMTIDGARVDPEPHMFGKALTIGTLPDTSLEDEVLGPKTTFLSEPFRIVTGEGNAIRTDTRIADDTLHFRTSGRVELTIIGRAAGDEFPIGSGNRLWYVYGAHQRGLRAIHSAVCQRIPELVVDCTPAVKAATLPLTNKIDRARTAASGVVQGAQAIVEALK